MHKSQSPVYMNNKKSYNLYKMMQLYFKMLQLYFKMLQSLQKSIILQNQKDIEQTTKLEKSFLQTLQYI